MPARRTGRRHHELARLASGRAGHPGRLRIPAAGQRQLSATLDEFWNHPLSVPADALTTPGRGHAALVAQRATLGAQKLDMEAANAPYMRRIAGGEPFGAIVAGRLPLVWAQATVIADSPDRRQVDAGTMVGRLMSRGVADATQAARSELLIIAPYPIPGQEGMRMLGALRARQVRVRILTSSLEASKVLLAQSGYMGYRVPLLTRWPCARPRGTARPRSNGIPPSTARPWCSMSSPRAAPGSAASSSFRAGCPWTTSCEREHCNLFSIGKALSVQPNRVRASNASSCACCAESPP